MGQGAPDLVMLDQNPIIGLVDADHEESVRVVLLQAKTTHRYGDWLWARQRYGLLEGSGVTCAALLDSACDRLDVVNPAHIVDHDLPARYLYVLGAEGWKPSP